MKAALASAAKQWPAALVAMSDEQTSITQQPVVIGQGGNGLGSVIAR